jgi:NAD(P)H-dependent nitrite reductase small subunit
MGGPQGGGRRIARRNLGWSIFAEGLGFSVWLIWSVSSAFLVSLGFDYSPQQLFLLVALPNLVGSVLRLPYTVAVPRFGGRNWTMISAGLLLVPTLGFAWAVQPCATRDARRGGRPGPPRCDDRGRRAVMTTRSQTWTRVCRLEHIDVEGGVTALVGGVAVAVLRTHDDHVFALANYDPFSKASVLGRGIVGTRGDIPFVASPTYKQAFALRDGHCLDDAAVRVLAYDVQVTAGVVLVDDRKAADTS